MTRDKDARFLPDPDVEFCCECPSLEEDAQRLKHGVFRLLNKDVNLGIPVNWDPSGTTRLWRYNLHYFDYAVNLAFFARSKKDQLAAELLGRLFHEWIESNPLGKGVGWHSYPIARRIVNWIQAVSLAPANAVFQSSDDQAAWLRSLFRQALYLESHLEFDILGNHLLADAKALIFAGGYFEGAIAARWRDLGRRLLWRGLEEQVLDDGGHYERSPMYHAIVLQDYLEIVLVYQLNGLRLPAGARDRLILMGDYLAGILQPDGEIPLFADSAFGIAHKPADILAAAERLLEVPGRWTCAKPGRFCGIIAPRAAPSAVPVVSPQPPRSSWPSTGYVVLQGTSPGDRLIVDAKPMGPEDQPGHGHCSLFSYELSLDGERIIVDSGVEEYEPGPWRDFWRSTRAHNTVLVDGTEQSEIWAAFRVGERVQLLEYTCLQTNSSSLFIGAHSGFARQANATRHRRFIAALPAGIWLVLEPVINFGRANVQDCRA